jgi:cytochrome c553
MPKEFLNSTSWWSPDSFAQSLFKANIQVRLSAMITTTEHEMKAHITTGMTALALLLATSPLMADKGKALYEKNCTRCHGTEVFTREDRGIKSLDGLKNRVKQCSFAAEAKWADDEIGSVVEYLNRDFYKF